VTLRSRLFRGFGAGLAAVSLIWQMPLAAEPDVVSQSPASGHESDDKMERGLWLLMDEAERDLRNSPLVIRDPALNDYVREVLCKTAPEAECDQIRIYIVRSADFNASMAPNGMMQVWSGLLLRTQNEAQLASVLGHEFTHYEKRHGVQLFHEIKRKTDAAAFLSVIPYAGLLSLGLISSIFSFNRDMEREADTGGITRMAAAGYDTREAARIWERLRAEMDATAAERKRKSRKNKNGGLYATHPPSAERVKNLTEQSATLLGVPGETVAARYREALSAWWPQFVDDQLKLNDYGASGFLLDGIAAEGDSPWLYYARGELFRRRAGEGDLARAVDAYSRAIATGGDLPEIWRGRGRGLAQIKLKWADAGKADLKEYLRRAPEATDRSMISMLAGEQL